MPTFCLAGLKIAVVIENLFIPDEIKTYRRKFAGCGAEIHFLSRLWGQREQVFIPCVEKSDYDDPKYRNTRIRDLRTVRVNHDVEKVFLNDYAAILMAANYTAVRCRYYDVSRQETPRCTPVVRFFADAMRDKRIVKGFLCHALWILTPVPELLSGRKVICHEVVRCDVENAGGILADNESGIVVDDDLVTGKSGLHAEIFADTIISEIRKRRFMQRSF